MNDLTKTMAKFREGRRYGSEYKVFRAIHMRLADMATTISPKQNHKDAVIEDLENIAVKRAIDKYAWFKDKYIWTRPHKARKTYIRYDLFETFERIIREDKFLRDFLINAELLMMIDNYHDDKEKFWKEMEGEILECCKGERH